MEITSEVELWNGKPKWVGLPFSYLGLGKGKGNGIVEAKIGNGFGWRGGSQNP